MIDAPLRGVAAPASRSTSIVRGHLLPPPRRPGPVGATSGCGRSSAATSSTAASTASPTATGPASPAILIGSADLMPRNLDRRVEALVPVDEPELQARLEEILEVNLADDTLAWALDDRRRVAPRRRRGRPSTPTCACRRSPARGPAVAADLRRPRPERWGAVHLSFTSPSLRRHRGFLRCAATTCHL